VHKNSLINKKCWSSAWHKCCDLILCTTPACICTFYWSSMVRTVCNVLISTGDIHINVSNRIFEVKSQEVPPPPTHRHIPFYHHMIGISLSHASPYFWLIIDTEHVHCTTLCLCIVIQYFFVNSYHTKNQCSHQYLVQRKYSTWRERKRTKSFKKNQQPTRNVTQVSIKYRKF